MATIKDFEELEVWKLAREICKDIYKITQYPDLSRNYALVDQMRRSSGSIMDNIAEGFERGGTRELIHFLSIAKGSAGELRSQIVRVLDQQYIEQNEYEFLKEKIINEGRKLGKFSEYLKNSGIKGTKYKDNEENSQESEELYK